MQVLRTQKYRLYPTAEQAEKLAEFARVVRFIYNLALEQRRDFWRQFKRATGKSLNYVSQGRQLTELRAENDWIAAVPANCQHSALQDLDKAFAKFWRGGGYPQFRKAGTHETFEVKAADTGTRPLNRKWSQVRVPKIGWIKYRDTRPISGDIRSTRVVCEGGKWFACIGVRTEHEASASALAAVGIDRGVTLALAMSDGNTATVPHSLVDLDKAARRAGRVLSRRKRGSARYRKQRSVLAATKTKATRVRRDWQHKATTAICRDYGTVVIEALNTKGMTRRAHEKGVAQKRGLNRSILNVGWGSIEMMLTYKLEERGGTLIKINPAYTSQTCSACGTIDKGSRESQARFVCTSCGHSENADINAAKNILRQGLPGVDGGGCAPVEARTIHPRLAA
ncbi:RNA-guided endonuclease InsQ/TnpB family protein [Qipengyuania sp. MTN3-11]|uniref:RNA-guided endonuclease InsQ/TnpB family protein n=1 Tax=Qipengyuania sp. MTN3-11 TaxID=3056557 RepID=UPI0036F387AB